MPAALAIGLRGCGSRTSCRSRSASATSERWRSARSITSPRLLDNRGLLEIATRAAIAFDNAQLYSSLKREMSRAQSAEEQLQEANRRKDEFLAMLSHELRNPLAPIVTAAQVLDKVAPNDSRIAWVREVIERQVTHLAGLVDDLLDVSRITQGKITLHREAVELGKVIEHTLEIVRPLIDSKRHVLAVHVPDTPVWVFGDFSRLSQIFSNVLHNAAKYTTDGGNIELHVTARSRQRRACACATTESASSRSSCRTSSRCSRRVTAGSTAARAGWASASPWFGASWSCIRGRST